MDFPTALGGGSGMRSTEPNTTTATPLDLINASWKTANDAYQQKQYGAALIALDKIATIDPNFELENRGDYFFKKGLVQLKMDKFADAIASFEAVTEGDYIANAQWKRALTLLKTNPAEAKKALTAIVNSPHPEKVTAAEILKDL